MDEAEGVGWEVADVAGGDQVAATSYYQVYKVRQMVMNSVCTRNPGKAAANAYPCEYPSISYATSSCSIDK